MHLELFPLTPSSATEDPTLIPRLAYVHLASFLTNAVYAGIYPLGFSTPSILQASENRHLAALTTDPSARYLAVVDRDVTVDPTAPHTPLPFGLVVAFAKYQLFATAADEAARKDTSERTWPPGVNLPLVTDFWAQIQVVRRRWGPRLGGHVQVDLLATVPTYFRRGAAVMLMERIAAEADDLGLPGFLEGSPEGLKVYERVGFRGIGEEVRVDLGRYDGGEDRGAEWRTTMQGEVVEEEEEEEDREGKAGVGARNFGWYRNVVMVRPAKGKKLEDYLGQ